MNRFIFILSAMSVVECTGLAAPNADQLPPRDRDKIVELAKGELTRRHVPLPRGYDVRVSDGVIGNELEKDRQIYVVHFRFVYRGKKGVIYTVFIDKRSEKIDYFFDARKMVPSRM